MHQTLKSFVGQPLNLHAWDQGFVDQRGNFYCRVDAMKIVKASGQPFDPKRNGSGNDELYSEGIY